MKLKLFCLSSALIFAFAMVNVAEASTPNQVPFTAAERAEIDRFVAEFGDDVRAVETAPGFYAGATLLHRAAANWNAAVAKYLVSKGADVNAKDNWDWTPLHKAARHNSNVEVLKYLVSQGADVNARNRGGVIPLDVARNLGGHPQIVAYLEGIGDDQQAPNQVQTAPRYAAQPASDYRPVEAPRVLRPRIFPRLFGR